MAVDRTGTGRHLAPIRSLSLRWLAMDPADALERIAYLLDRSLADSRKAAAFLRAAEIVRELPADELERRGPPPAR